MTRQEAISVLNMVEAHGDIVIEAKKKAIEALSQPVRKNGKWIDVRDYCGEFLCSNCHEINRNNFYKYCPYCGAEMEVDNDRP